MSVLLVWMCSAVTVAQAIKISGVIVDKQSDEPIPFSTAVFKLSGQGVLTDSSGRFVFTSGQWSHNDTLQISSVGYKNVLIPSALFKDSAFFTVKMELLPSNDVVVKSKYNRALWFWRKIMQHKADHERTHWNNFYYEAYNKLELDIANINTAKLSKNFLVKPL
ncbi:MAG: carboxypeptidase-like regulatory domain-containing protein, partial [Hydrotalea flava]|nr:carboxypeptidase-like regulatory domain-containing protein [Hydrotalea flava]